MSLEGEQLTQGAVPPSLLAGPLARFARDKSIHLIGGPTDASAEQILLSFHDLQDIPDYRLAIRGWFDRVGAGGLLILIVPHAFLSERQLVLPSPWHPRQRRLYTPASLAAEVEEALVPNSYRVRWLGDLDEGYDYARSPTLAPSGQSDAAVVLERIVPPTWSVTRDAAPSGAVRSYGPDYAFEPPRTRIEVGSRPPLVRRILLLKLDHLGDLIMGMPALERMRRYFPDATIDLVVGSWNADMARELGVADRVIAFDAFPRNSTEEHPNVEATLGLFRTVVSDSYDLAIDMRTDTDTRTLLRAADARLKAGIGTHSQLPFMDIALPLDTTRNEAERAQEDQIGPGYFRSQGSVRRGHFNLHSNKDQVERGVAIIWGPYRALEPGNYIFDFHIDLEEQRGDGLLKLDIAIDNGRTVSEMIISGPATFQLPFRIDAPETQFEARIWTVDDRPSIGFSFFGGRLIRQGRGNVLHQTEYGVLLVELVKLRVQELDMLEDAASA